MGTTRRARLVRFALDTLAESNAHHDFERLCLALARHRVTSNLVPATGPVSGGGDQGRDGESHWTNLPNEGVDSVFATLASPENVVLACTIQKSDVAAKISRDLGSICSRGQAVNRVVYFTVAPVTVAKRHQLQEEARDQYEVKLDIWDAAAIAEHLSDPDLFPIAVEHLHLPEIADDARWTMAMPDTSDAVARPDLLDAVVTALGTAPSSSVVLTGLEGAGGFGKTTLAAMACRDSRVASRFPDGVLWLTIGENLSGADLASVVNDLVEYLTGRRPTYIDPGVAGSHLATVIGKRMCLLVLDDVWRSSQLAPFLTGAPNCVRLITTRIGAVIPAGVTWVHVDLLSKRQAEDVLSRGVDVERLTLSGLVARTGRWPVLCGLVNGTMRRRLDRGAGVVETVRWAESMLDRGGPSALDTTDSTAREHAVEATVAASLTMLNDSIPGAVERYRELGVFPADVEIPLATVARFWAYTGGITEHEAERLCHALAELNLVDEFRLGPPAIRLHDVLAAYLQYAARPRAAVLNRDLLDSHRADLPIDDDLPTAWWRLPAAEPYLWRHLARHLRAADRTDELKALLADLRWASVKIHRTGSASVESDASELPGDLHARALTKLLRGTSHLYQPGDALGITIATFAAYAMGDAVLGPRATALVDRITTPHLRPTTQCLPDQPHSAVSRVFTVHGLGPRAIVMAPDGSWLASAGSGDPVRMWNPKDGTELRSMPMNKGAWTLVSAPDGSWLAAGGRNGTVKLWDTADSSKCLSLTGHTDLIRAMAAASNGSWLVTASDDHSVIVWDTEDGSAREVITDVGPVGKLVVSPDSSWFAVAAGWVRHLVGKVVHLGDTTSLVSSPRALIVAPDGSWLATGGFETVQMWDPVDGRLVHNFTGHHRWVSALAVAPDGSWLASAGEDGVVRLWDPATGKNLAELTGHSGPVETLAVSPDGGWLASAGGDSFIPDDTTVRIWDLADHSARAVLTGHSAKINCLVSASDGTRLASGAEDGTIRLWDLADSVDPSDITGHTGRVDALAVAPDGAWLASAGVDGSVRLWSPADGTERAILSGHNGYVKHLVAAPDGVWLASAGHDGRVRLWNPDDGTATVLETGDHFVQHLVAASDGTWLAAIAYQDTLWVWETATGRVLVGPRRIAIPVGRMFTLGSLLGCVGDNGDIRLWDPFTGECVGALARRGIRVSAVSSAPDAAWFAVAGGHYDVEVLTLDGGHETLRGHSGEVHGFAVAPDGSWFASAGDCTVRLWRADDFAQQGVVRHEGNVLDLAVAPDGSWLASVSSDGAVKCFTPQGKVWASVRLDSGATRCVINPVRPQLMVAGSRHVFFLDVHQGFERS